MTSMIPKMPSRDSSQALSEEAQAKSVSTAPKNTWRRIWTAETNYWWRSIFQSSKVVMPITHWSLLTTLLAVNLSTISPKTRKRSTKIFNSPMFLVPMFKTKHLISITQSLFQTSTEVKITTCKDSLPKSRSYWTWAITAPLTMWTILIEAITGLPIYTWSN